MSQTVYRRRAILARIHKALDAFYLLQKIDWEYDIRETLERILALAVEEVEFDGGRLIERALIIVQSGEGLELEVQAGYNADVDLGFSRTVVQETLERGEAIFCDDAKGDPRFMEAESIKSLDTLSLMSVPLQLDGRPIGAVYVESSSGTIFDPEDVDFLREFADTTTPYIKTAITHQDHVRTIRKLKEAMSERYRLDNLIGRSERIQGVFDLIRIAASVDRTVLITGESGCGKELVAKAIHHNSDRRHRPFVVVDCSSLAEHLLESELFGHRRGAFTGAASDKIGAFEEANGGTIFLDEISDASKSLQQKLRRVLQEGEIRRVGDNEVHSVDVRVICATNRNLADLVQSGDFIRDLYFRINKFPIHVPPLRERREDIPILAHHFLSLTSRPHRPGPVGLTPEAIELLTATDWEENNIRELRNAVELAADFADGGAIDRPLLERVLAIQKADRRAEPGTIPTATADDSLVRLNKERFARRLAEHQSRHPNGGGSKVDTPFYEAQLELAGRIVIEGLRACDWKLRPAARLLGISPMKLRGELREFIDSAVRESGGDVDAASRRLDIPVDVLEKKKLDLGLD